jgi:hypothetical protein
MQLDSASSGTLVSVLLWVTCCAVAAVLWRSRCEHSVDRRCQRRDTQELARAALFPNSRLPAATNGLVLQAHAQASGCLQRSGQG